MVTPGLLLTPLPVVDSDTFLWVAGDDFEDATNHGPGGLFPVKLGDTLGPENSARYRITAKLSHGSYSTVWLAEDFAASRAVTVKIVDASESATSREEVVLKHLRTTRSDSPAVLQLLDSFRLTSVNSIHLVLVAEPVMLLWHLLKLPGVPANIRNIARQALQGLAFIHKRGIVHGDLCPDNFGVAIPDLDNFSADDIWTSTGAPEVFPLVARDRAHDTASFPPCLTRAMDGKDLVDENPEFAAQELCIRIMDLGCAYFAETSPSPHCPAAREVQAEKDAHELVALLRRMVVMDPMKRPPASELLLLYQWDPLTMPPIPGVFPCWLEVAARWKNYLCEILGRSKLLHNYTAEPLLQGLHDGYIDSRGEGK